jgi:hypothetical protein
VLDEEILELDELETELDEDDIELLELDKELDETWVMTQIPLFKV